VYIISSTICIFESGKELQVKNEIEDNAF